MFPKQPKKKKRKKHHGSILPTKKGVCYLCGRQGITHEHHIFFGKGNRQHSERYGLKADLCVDCHELGADAVHRNAEVSRKLEKEAQEAFERVWGSREEFMKIFGINVL